MKLAVAGPNGRMGQAVREALAQAQGATFVEGLFEQADGVIDFTSPAYSLELSKQAAALGKIHIIGTTGFSAEEEKHLRETAAKARTVWSYNMSVGVNLVAALVEQAAHALDANYDVEIVEMHHRLKKDAPSGTALMLSDSAAKGRDVKLSDVETYYPKGMIGERKSGAIGIAARRGGGVIGDHTVTFAGINDVIDITHRSMSRSIYAEGAIAAAKWLQSKPNGLYTMRDVVGI